MAQSKRAPKQVTNAATRAEDIHAGVYPVDEATAAEAAVDPTGADVDGGAEVVELQPEPEPGAGDPVSTEPGPPAEDDWQHKYDVLQGKYSAEVPQLSAQVRDLHAQLEGMRDLVATMEPPAAAATPVPLQPATGVTAEDTEAYGSDLIDLARRISREEFMPEIEKLRQENAQLQQNIGGVTERVAVNSRDAFHAQLSQQVEDWQALNTDPGFGQWLDQVDPFTGAARRQLLQQAYTNLDLERVAVFFNTYKRENAAVSPQAPGIPAAPAAGGVQLEDLAAPRRASRSTAGAPSGDKRIWSQQEIANFYAGVRRGEYRNKEADQAAIETEIILAARENRVR